MELYNEVSAELARLLTARYSTSFSSASRLFPRSLRTRIYTIYGLVRIADEIVDTYQGDDKAAVLAALRAECYDALRRGYSANPIVHAFALTARDYAIGKDLIDPFFDSMELDIEPQTYGQELYERYIYGSAEVVGLMCLKVFTAGDSEQYAATAPGARRLGAAYQKVNFLRDIAADHKELGRFYFPGMTFAGFDDQAKRLVTDDIRADFTAALPHVMALPDAARPAVMMSYRYFERLLARLETTPASVIKVSRIRLPGYQKLALLTTQLAKPVARKRS